MALLCGLEIWKILLTSLWEKISEWTVSELLKDLIFSKFSDKKWPLYSKPFFFVLFNFQFHNICFAYLASEIILPALTTFATNSFQGVWIKVSSNGVESFGLSKDSSHVSKEFVKSMSNQRKLKVILLRGLSTPRQAHFLLCT